MDALSFFPIALENAKTDSPSANPLPPLISSVFRTTCSYQIVVLVCSQTLQSSSALVSALKQQHSWGMETWGLVTQ